MPKKRGKLKAKPKAISKIQTKKAKALKKKTEAQKPVSVKKALDELEILSEEKKVEQKVEDIEKKEEEIEKEEQAIVSEEKKIEEETEKVEKLEEEIKKEVTQKPLTKFNIRDLYKGIIGAFIGVVAHFAFLYGKTIAKYISVPRATLLLVLSYLLIVILMYETGYREIKEKRLLWVLPRRATIIYFTSLIMIVVIFFLFNMLDLSDPIELYKQIAVTSVLASVGAGTADLIGKD